ncbi:hypothetical protein BOX15_Mlig004572g1, partial [Macrostomum lignano]
SNNNNSNHSNKIKVADKTADAYRRRRDRNNEAARASRQNRKERHEALRLACAHLSTAVAPIVRLRRLQAEAEVRSLCSAAGQSYEALLTSAAQQIGLPANFLNSVLAGVRRLQESTISPPVDEQRQRPAGESSDENEKCR